MSTPRLNVVLIVIDALRARNLSCYGYPKETSPNIDRLAAEGAVFERAYATVNTTDPSLTTIFTGMFPLRHGIVNHGARVSEGEIDAFNRGDTSTLAESLRSHGYATCAVDWMGRWHRRGFDLYSEESTRPPRKGWLRRAVSSYYYRLPDAVRTAARKSLGLLRPELPVTRRYADVAIDFLNSTSQDFFLFIHFWGTHTPYQSPKDLRARFRDRAESPIDPAVILGSIQNPEYRNYYRDNLFHGARDAADVVAAYDGAIFDTDREIGRLVQTLKAKGVYDRTLIIITSDHGESLTEHGIYFDHHGLYQETLHVPLILSCPAAVPKARRVPDIVQHVDIMPTVLTLTGCEPARQPSDGVSLRPLLLGERYEGRGHFYSEEFNRGRRTAVSDGQSKLLFSPPGGIAECEICGRVHGDDEELYDLISDPAETTNLASSRPDVVARLMREHDRLTEGTRAGEGDGERQRIRQRIRRLRVAERRLKSPGASA